MQTFKSNLLLNISVESDSSITSTEEFSQYISQEIQYAIEEHLRDVVDDYDIVTELLTTDLISTSQYTPLSSIQNEQNDYVSLASLLNNKQTSTGTYTPLIR